MLIYDMVMQKFTIINETFQDPSLTIVLAATWIKIHLVQLKVLKRSVIFWTEDIPDAKILSKNVPIAQIQMGSKSLPFLDRVNV